MRLSTPYVLPFQVKYQEELVSGEHDITLRVLLADLALPEAVGALDATVLPFLLLLTSGALAGDSIEPWTSTVKQWGKPIILGATIEWPLKSVACDLQAWVVLAQMLLVDHTKYTIQRIEILDSQRPYKMVDVMTNVSGANPYPKRWAGTSFPIAFYKDLPKSFTVYVTFAHPLSASEKEGIEEEFSAWAPGLILGAYGVAPVPPDRCTGRPAEDIVFIDNQLEWPISNFKAHTGAIEGLINVVASISHKLVQVMEFRVE